MNETDGSAMQTAVRTDPAEDVREEARFFGTGQRLFGVTHRPADASVGVVVCSPIHAELLRNYRREVDLARSLARSGYAVQRFHYRGSGSSDGEPGSVTFESLADDVAAAAEVLVATTGVECLVYVGTRLGAVAAAVAARSTGAAGFAAWEPVLNGDRYFREIFRGHLVSGLKKTHNGQERKPQQEMSELGSVDVLGYPIDRPLYESVRARRLMDDLAVASPHILLLRIGGSKNLAGEQETLVGRWRDTGATVQTYLLPGGEPWWFGLAPEMASEDPTRGETLVEVTTEWLLRSVPPRA